MATAICQSSPSAHSQPLVTQQQVHHAPTACQVFPKESSNHRCVSHRTEQCNVLQPASHLSSMCECLCVSPPAACVVVAECAPGFAGKGQDGLCKRCPAGTDIAVGGPMTKSVCLKCPEGSFVNPEGTDCVCAAGHYRVVADQPAGYRKVACQPCAARNAYMAEDGHTKEACSLCKMGLVANKEHTDCGEYSDVFNMMTTPSCSEICMRHAPTSTFQASFFVPPACCEAGLLTHTHCHLQSYVSHIASAAFVCRPPPPPHPTPPQHNTHTHKHSASSQPRGSTS